MADNNFNTTPGQTIARELMIAYLNTGTDSSPVWSPFGRRTTDSSIEYDWSEDSSQDILGNTWTTMKKPTMSQSFDPWDLDGGDAAQQKIYQLAVIEQNAQALTNMDVMIAHFYSGSKEAAFAERYSACMVKPSSLGGEGGGNLGMPVDVTYGGERTVGTVSKGAGGAVTFTPAASATATED
ncbi:hypothetical protein [Oscillibacter sp. 1-3]|uniref:hypothetical protein n=1 Tax=Oscillibacter sp. 1-3 TaxID=1235797 RepID=UPI0003398561|nr:hypothetical protein [Oscillibacter sp. 1-3]EOS62533.1 hypothetical protein C816_04186 [Oscillibacter sp. 1-3]